MPKVSCHQSEAAPPPIPRGTLTQKNHDKGNNKGRDKGNNKKKYAQKTNEKVTFWGGLGPPSFQPPSPSWGLNSISSSSSSLLPQRSQIHHPPHIRLPREVQKSKGHLILLGQSGPLGVSTRRLCRSASTFLGSQEPITGIGRKGVGGSDAPRCGTNTGPSAFFLSSLSGLQPLHGLKGAGSTCQPPPFVPFEGPAGSCLPPGDGTAARS